MENRNGILKMIGDKAVNNSQNLVDKLYEVMGTKMGSGKEIGEFINPYEMFSGLIEIFQNKKINAEPKFANRIEAIESIIFDNDELQDIFHDDQHTIADYGLALIIAGGVMMDLDYYADEVVKDKIKDGSMTKDDLQELADSNIQGLKMDTIQSLKKMFVNKKECGDCENCDACIGTPVDEKVEIVKGSLPDSQRDSLYKLINDGQITADTIHNLITSGSVTVQELISNIKSDVLGPLMEGVHNIVSKTLGKAGHSVTETTDRTILRGASVKAMSFNNKSDILEAMDRLKGGVSDEEKALREKIAAGELSDAQIADAIYTFRVNPYFVDLHISDKQKEILADMLTKRLFKL